MLGWRAADRHKLHVIPMKGFIQITDMCSKAQAELSSRGSAADSEPEGSLLMMHVKFVFKKPIFRFATRTNDVCLRDRHCSTALCKQCTAICSFDLCRSHYRNAQLVFSNLQPGWVFGSSSCCVYLCHEYRAVSMPHISCAVQQRQYPSPCTANAVK